MARSRRITREELDSGWDQYVCWIDMMGAENAMRGSIADAAVRIVQIHQAALENTDECTVIPVIDGVFIVGMYQYAVLSIVDRTMATVAKNFIRTRSHRRRTLVRGGIAYGPVALGFMLADYRRGLAKYKAYTEHLLIGLPLLHAYQAERSAPPFGIAVHESARTRAADGDSPLPSVFYKWWENADLKMIDKLEQRVDAWYSWAQGSAN